MPAVRLPVDWPVCPARYALYSDQTTPSTSTTQPIMHFRGPVPHKGLTLPLMSYGRSSLIVSLAWVGLLLRVYHEAMLEKRGSATVRQRSSVLGDREARKAKSSARPPPVPEPPPESPAGISSLTARSQAELLIEDEDGGEEE